MVGIGCDAELDDERFESVSHMSEDEYGDERMEEPELVLEDGEKIIESQTIDEFVVDYEDDNVESIIGFKCCKADCINGKCSISGAYASCSCGCNVNDDPVCTSNPVVGD